MDDLWAGELVESSVGKSVAETAVMLAASRAVLTDVTWVVV